MTRAAFALVLTLAAGCTAAGPQRDGLQFDDELSRQIELMVRETERRVPASEPQTPVAVAESLVIPVKGVSVGQLRSNFGEFRSNGRSHMGIDIFAARGTPVLAATSGVIKLLEVRELSGRCLWLENERGDIFFYAHLDRWTPGLFEGQRVNAGDVLGFVGNTGNAADRRPHLHFETHRDGVAVDPYILLASE